MTKAYVLLSGCGSRDGSEIHEATLALLALDQRGVTVQCIAPDVAQARVFNHYTGRPDPSTRRVIEEGARIARGDIRPLKQALPEDADLLVLPGGLGAATTLCTFFEHKEHATILPEVKALIEGFYNAKKPIVVICISPALIAITFKNTLSVKLTLGTHPDLLSFLQTMGMEPVACSSDSYVMDATHRIISTPAYNEPVSIATVWKGIQGAIDAALTISPDTLKNKK
jgi:enhancing lycopene biosynthesis protein 2